jgi:hypothetical protein
MTKGFEIVEIGVEEAVDLGFGIKDCLLLDVALRGRGRDFFYRSMLCKWTTLLARFYIGPFLPMETKFNANIGCVMSLEWSYLR